MSNLALFIGIVLASNNIYNLIVENMIYVKKASDLILPS
jgi:hypothetical protein